MDAKIAQATRYSRTSTNGLITFEVTVPLWVWVELLTHKRLSRNAISKRAAGVEKHAALGPYVPPVFYAQGNGMSAGEPLPLDVQIKAAAIWLEGYERSVQCARELHDLGVCKEQANRKIDASCQVRGVVTATENGWREVLYLRTSTRPGSVADSAMRELATDLETMIDMISALDLWNYSDHHMPYWSKDLALLDITTQAKICGARIARLSFGEARAHSSDLSLADRLCANKHLSPFEHIAARWDADPCPLSAINCKPEDCSEKSAWYSYRARLEEMEIV